MFYLFLYEIKQLKEHPPSEVCFIFTRCFIHVESVKTAPLALLSFKRAFDHRCNFKLYDV